MAPSPGRPPKMNKLKQARAREKSAPTGTPLAGRPAGRCFGTPPQLPQQKSLPYVLIVPKELLPLLRKILDDKPRSG